jgi:hypothetical protein
LLIVAQHKAAFNSWISQGDQRQDEEKICRSAD